MAIDRETRSRIRTAADERAAKGGMRFDGERAAFVCDWIEANCCLYEGELAGQPLSLYAAQRDFVERLFGWVRWSDERGQWIRRFTRAGLWKAKKNGKSPLAAAINLYLLCGDGEPGQKVYMMAKNGEQAKIAQTHSIMMTRQSPKLAADCKINNTTLSITHTPTNSVLSLVTGDDKRGADAKHGYNGSVTIDEMHVVSRTMMEAVGRAGLSRKEPLQLSFSTSGTDPSSPGYERFQYGRQVNSGDRRDDHFLHVEYCAPDGATEAEIDAHLEEYGKMANPAWGTLIMPSQFRADWEAVKGNPREVAIFKMERLNMWVGSKNQWLSLKGWEKGRRKFALADMRGRGCWLGIDLSRTRDMTAVPFLFDQPDDGPEVLRLWPQFWLPQARAEELDHLFPFRSWAAAGDLAIVPGEVVDYARVEADVIRAVEENYLTVRGIYFDQWSAEEITQRLAARFNCERVAVRQGYYTLSSLCKEFERRTIVGQVQHPGNRVMDWQVSHVEVRPDANRNIMPCKPDAATGKSIDGVAAAINAMAGAVSQTADVPTLTFI